MLVGKLLPKLGMVELEAALVTTICWPRLLPCTVVCAVYWFTACWAFDRSAISWGHTYMSTFIFSG